MTFGELKERCAMLERQNSEWQRHTKELEAKLAEAEDRIHRDDIATKMWRESIEATEARVEALEKALEEAATWLEHHTLFAAARNARAALAAGKDE